MIRKLTFAIMLILALAVFSACDQGGTGDGSGETGGTVTAGTNSTSTPAFPKAPDLTYTTFDGSTGSLGDHMGKPVVLNFWAAWCPPCKAEMPEFEAMYKKYEGQFELIAIAVDDKNDPEAFFATSGYTYIPARSAQVGKYVEMSIPVTAFIDRQGNLVHKQTGMINGEAFESYLKKIL